MRSGHCPQCGAYEVFRRTDQQEALVALLSPAVLATQPLPIFETYACGCCGYFECYGQGQRLFDKALNPTEVTPAPHWQRVLARTENQRHASTHHEFTMQECPKCGSRVRHAEVCHICGETSAGASR